MTVSLTRKVMAKPWSLRSVGFSVNFLTSGYDFLVNITYFLLFIVIIIRGNFSYQIQIDWTMMISELILCIARKISLLLFDAYSGVSCIEIY